MKGVRLHLEGQRYGRLVVVRFYGMNKHHASMWECRCDCGKTVVVGGPKLRDKRARHQTRSCGCYAKEVWDTHFVRPRSRDRNTCMVIHEYKTGARRRGIEWGLSDDQAMELFAGNCCYCGAPPNGRRDWYAGPAFTFNGIDRLDPSHGYTVDNCVSCCSFCNYTKNDTPYNQFVGWIDRVYHHIHNA